MPNIPELKNTPDISFIDNKTIDQIRSEMVADFENYMEKETGNPTTLPKSSERRMELYAAAAQIYQAMQYIDRAGKQNLLKYSYSDFLDNLALLKGITRMPAKAATATLRFTLSAVRDAATGIPQGTRVSANGAVYFATNTYTEIPAGDMTVDTEATCTVTGTVGNGMGTGELSAIVDPIPYVASAKNTAKTGGGTDREMDVDLAERIYLAPGAYSTAGPKDGYLYHAKQYNPGIGDVVATSNQAAGTVEIVFIMSDGSTPGTEMINGLQGYLQDNNVRPMTDLVTVSAPEEIGYTINATYYINRSDNARAVSIQTEVSGAVEKYKTWQRAIGRDINPSKLTEYIMAAGAKRVEVTAPIFAKVGATAVPGLSGAADVKYGGVEDD